MKTDYKRRKGNSVPFSISKWKMPFALSMLAFAILWRSSTWWPPHEGQMDDEEWAQANQVTLDIALPQNQAQTLLIQPTTIAKIAATEDIAWKIYTIKAGASLASYFQLAGLDSKALQEVLSLKRDAHYLKKIYPGQVLKLRVDDNGQLHTLHFDVDPLTTLIIHRHHNGKLVSHVEEKPIEKRVAFGGATISESLFGAGKAAQLDDALIMELANVFAYDIDFAQDIQPNDYFKVLFEEYFVNGVKVGNGPIVAAEFFANGKKYQAIRYTDPTGQAFYYSPKGESLKKAFIRTPVQFTRISSHFNLQRRHPILHTIRAHKGVDYAAPHGTPVKASGQGKVAFVGKKGGYGNVIILQHGPHYSTLYGHLSNFAKKLKVGKAVRQGEIIGYVGATGLASGPHLHYEFRIDGVHRDPLTVPLPQAEDVPAHAKAKFLAQANEWLHIMDRQQKVMVASNEI